MTIEDKLKQCIIENYGTLNDFCDSIEMPKSTLFTILKRGVMSCSITTMFKICDGLGIDIQALTDGEIVYVSKKNEAHAMEFQAFLKELECSVEVFTYKHKELSLDERRLLAYALKVSLEQLKK